eukprot:scaffold302769_cov20-Tisochrysis_lutea.AAC.1
MDTKERAQYTGILHKYKRPTVNQLTVLLPILSNVSCTSTASRARQFCLYSMSAHACALYPQCSASDGHADKGAPAGSASSAKESAAFMGWEVGDTRGGDVMLSLPAA